jgi:hypothetical protein
MSDAVVVVLAVCLVTAVVASVLACLAVVLWRKRAAEARLAAAAIAAAELGKAGLTPSMRGEDGEQPPSQRSSGSHDRDPGSGSVQQLELSSAQEPVHDSSDSYPLPDRALLRAELARSQLLGSRRSSEDGDGVVGSWQQGLRQPPPAAVAGGISTTSAASDAALQRLHSAITTMSQDVLSRRLQVSSGNLLSGQSSGASTAGGAGPLSRPSPLGLARESPHAHFLQQQQLQQQQQQQQQQQEGRVSGSFGSAAAASDVSSQSLPAQDAAAAAGDVVEQDDAAAGALQPAAAGAAQQQARPTSNCGSMARSSLPGVNTLGELKLLQLVGQGTFGQVYKALWRRRCVAVKVLQLPATAGNGDASPWAGVARVSSHREKMAVMETVVSTTMSHPNIVQVIGICTFGLQWL